jgi:hypothetical protein
MTLCWHITLDVTLDQDGSGTCKLSSISSVVGASTVVKDNCSLTVSLHVRLHYVQILGPWT